MFLAQSEDFGQLLFWILFIQTLHLPTVRTLLENSRQAVERTFGALLVFLGVRVATLD